MMACFWLFMCVSVVASDVPAWMFTFTVCDIVPQANFIGCLSQSAFISSRYTSRQTILNFDLATHLKNDISHHFPLLTPSWLLGSAGNCQTKSGIQWGIRRTGIWPCLCDTDWLTMAARLLVFYLASQCPGFQLLSLLREGMSVPPLGPWKHSQKKGQQCSCIQRSVNDNIV